MVLSDFSLIQLLNFPYFFDVLYVYQIQKTIVSLRSKKSQHHENYLKFKRG